MKRFYIIFCACFVSNTSFSYEYTRVANDSNLVYKYENYTIKENETLDSISFKFNTPKEELLERNPSLLKFDDISHLIISVKKKIIVPESKEHDIIINLADLKLYYYPENKSIVHIFPVGVGRGGWETPLMDVTISQMIKNPTWTPTKRIKENYKRKHGKDLPNVVPAGPENPLGDFAMRLNFRSGQYLIHGTNTTIGNGMRISSGCIRMNPPDIKWLYPHLYIGAKVKIINEPFKYTKGKNQDFFVEVHENNNKKIFLDNNIVKLPFDIFEAVQDDKESLNRLEYALNNYDGIPLKIK